MDMGGAALFEATGDDKRARDVLCHAEWGTRLTVPQFVAREERLRAHPWAEREMRTWLWRASAKAGASVMASCETFRMDSVWHPPGAVAPGRGNTYGVASVFTEPALRGRGHATAMMKALVSRLREEDRAAHASILFSDVGAPLYERAGYAAVPQPWDLVFDSAPLAAIDSSVRLFDEHSVPVEWAQVAMPQDEPFLVWPSASQLDWHLERERAYAELLGGRRPEAAGAAVRVNGHDARIFWAADFKNTRLAVLHLDAETLEAKNALLTAARAVAHRSGLSKVVLWEDPRAIDAHTTALPEGAVPVRRDGELPMVAPLNVAFTSADWRTLPRALWV